MKINRTNTVLASTAVVLAGLPSSLLAQTTLTWDGLGDGSTYEDGANWGGTAPTDDLTTNIIELTGTNVLLASPHQVNGVILGGGNLDGGTLEVGSGGIAVNANIDINTGIITNSSLNLTVNSNFDQRAIISGSGDLAISGGNTIEWFGSGTYNNTSIDATEILLRNGGDDALGTGVITLTNGGKIKNRNNNPTINNDIVLGTGGGIIEVGWNNRSITFNGEISGSSDLVISNDSSNARLVSENNTYTGNTSVLGRVNARSNAFGTGAITLDDGDAAGINDRGFIQNFEPEAGGSIQNNDLIISANGGTLKAGWDSDLEFTGVLSGTGTIDVNGDSGTIVFSNSANTYSGNIDLTNATSRVEAASLGGGSYDGVISGEGTFEYSGSGTQTLTATSTYTGTTTISSGTLEVAGDISASSSITVADGAALGGAGTGGDTLFQNGGQLDMQFGMLTLLDTATLSFEDFGLEDVLNEAWMTNSEGTYTLIAGDFTLNTAGLNNFGVANGIDRGDGFTVFFEEGSLAYTVQAIPEPSIAILGGLGLLGLLRRRRRA